MSMFNMDGTTKRRFRLGKSNVYLISENSYLYFEDSGTQGEKYRIGVSDIFNRIENGEFNHIPNIQSINDVIIELRRLAQPDSDGMMSKEDKQYIDELWDAFSTDKDGETVLEWIYKIISVFDNYPESLNLFDEIRRLRRGLKENKVLTVKIDKDYQTFSLIEEDDDIESVILDRIVVISDGEIGSEVRIYHGQDVIIDEDDILNDTESRSTVEMFRHIENGNVKIKVLDALNFNEENNSFIEFHYRNILTEG